MAVGQYPVDEFAEACFWHAFRELERVYWNVYQQQLDLRELWDVTPEKAPGKMFGIALRPYWWGEDDDDPKKALPNFSWGGLEVWWYKYAGRGMTCNVDWSPTRWAAWLGAILEHLRRVDRERDGSGE